MDKPTRGVKPDVVWKTPEAPDHVLADIDAHLAKPWSSHEQGSGRTWDLTKVTEVEGRAIINFYRKLGWDVQRHDDQREGSYLTFKAQAQSGYKE